MTHFKIKSSTNKLKFLGKNCGEIGMKQITFFALIGYYWTGIYYLFNFTNYDSYISQNFYEYNLSNCFTKYLFPIPNALLHCDLATHTTKDRVYFSLKSKWVH